MSSGMIYKGDPFYMDVINIIKNNLVPTVGYIYMHTGGKPHKIRNRVSLKLMPGDVKTIQMYRV